MQLRHAPLAFRIKPRERFLRSRDRLVVDVANQIIRRCPGFLLRLADYDVQPNAEPDRSTLFFSHAPHRLDLLFNLFWRLSPREVDVDLSRRELVSNLR